MSGRVIHTVSGPIESDRAGVTLIHEHLWMDARPLLAIHGYPPEAVSPDDPVDWAEARWNPGVAPDNYRLMDVELILQELSLYRAAGGRTVVDVTPSALGRDPARLVDIARRSGLNIVMGGGYYTEPTHPPGLSRRSVDDIAAELVAEIGEGVDGGGIRPGILGEIGTSSPVSRAEQRVLRAAARAHLATGISISVHLEPWAKEGVAVLDLLTGEGVPPERIILGHLSTAISDHAYLLHLARSGAYLAFDLFGFDHSLLGLGRYPPSDYEVARIVADLSGRGHLDRLLISGDIGVRTRLRAYGGWGFAHVPRHVVPLLQGLGLDGPSVARLLVENPARVLAVPADDSPTGTRSPLRPGRGAR